MSSPIGWCEIVKAATGDEAAYESYKTSMIYNMQRGAYTQFPCRHSPKCQATKEQIDALNSRFNFDLEKSKAK